ncbi:MAG: amidohydrolase, partial [Anaerolineaceae bacterium]|nr:amidohydrolase [Anaerolineaceae bacterium]
GWQQNDWPPSSAGAPAGAFPTAADLDVIATDKPIYLTAKSLHAAWANSAALKLANISDTSLDPVGGEYQRDHTRKVTGILLESAMEVVHNVVPKPTQAEITAMIERAQKTLWKMGLTGVHDYDGPDCFAALQDLQNAGKLQLRVHKSVPLENLEDAVRLGLRSGFGNEFLRIGSVKLFADGALGPQTAAMLQPYEGNHQQTGSLFLDREQVFEIGQRAVANGFSIAIHAIGDRANHEMLEGYADLRKFEQENGLPARRHRIEHVQLLHPDDLSRLAALGIIASVQPIHATSDMHIADRFWGSRSAGAYAFKTLLRQGTHVAFGSDAPVESPNPFIGMHAAVTRRRPDGTPSAEGWYPEQKISLTEALAGFTTGPAYAAGTEAIQGQLAPGFYADLIVLKQDPFTNDPMELCQLQPEATMVNGEWVFTI